MARPRTFDEALVLEGAMELFRERGLHGISIPELSERLGICKQSLYNAFGDKRRLYLSALRRWGEQQVEEKLALLDQAPSPLEGVRRLVGEWAGLAAICPSPGCLTVTAIVDNADDPDALAIVEGQVEGLERGLRAALVKAQALGELRAEASPERLARILISTCYGFGVLARLPGSGPVIEDSVATLLALLDDAAA